MCPQLAWMQLVDVRANNSREANGNDVDTAAKQPTKWRNVGDAANPDTLTRDTAPH